MKARHAFLLALVLLPVGCKSRPPADEEALVETLAALHLLGARNEELGDVPDAVLDSVVAAHGYTSETFQARLEKLAQHPDEMDSLFARVERRLLSLPRQSSPGDSLAR